MIDNKPAQSNDKCSAPTSDALLTENLALLLAEFPETEMRAIVEVLRAHRSWSPFPRPTATDAHRADNGAKLCPHAEAIAREILWWGSNDLWRQMGTSPSWKEVVALVAKSLGVPPKERPLGASCVDLEQAILRLEQSAVRDVVNGLPKILADWIGTAANLAGPQLTGQTAQGMWKMCAQYIGGGSPMAAVGEGAAAAAVEASAAAAAVEASAAAAVESGAAIGAVSVGAMAAGVVAAAVIVGGAAYIAAGPGERVLRPVVTIVARTRRGLRDKLMAESFAE